MPRYAYACYACYPRRGGTRNNHFLGFRRRSVRLFSDPPDLPGERGELRCGCATRFAVAPRREATKELFEVGPAPGVPRYAMLAMLA